MRLELIEVKNNTNRRKIIIIVVLTILFIVIFSALGIYLAKAYNKKNLANIKNKITQKNEHYRNINDLESMENSLKENINTTITVNNRNYKFHIPVYSNSAKEKMKNIYKNEEKVAYLTFDDGPSQAVTPLILDLLKQENIKATFFVLGSCVDKNPDLLKREYEEGHYIANHGYTHSYSKIYKSADNVINEYNRTEKSIKNAIKKEEYSSHLFRFPGGYYGGKYANVKKEAGKLLNDNNISYIDWNVLTGDAEGANTKEKIIDNIKKYTKNQGTIVILMHDAATKILTYETLKDVILILKEEGYTFNNFYSIMQ